MTNISSGSRARSTAVMLALPVLFLAAAPVATAAPTARAGGPYAITAGGSIVLNGAGSTAAAAGASIVSYEWDINADGVFGDLTGAEPTLVWSASFLPLQTSNISLLVTDSLGGTNTATTIITFIRTHLAVHDHFRYVTTAAKNPQGAPVFGSDGRLYGTTAGGGRHGGGTLWRMDADGTNFTVLHNLNSSSDGAGPRGAPVFGSDAKLYGTTVGGGGNNGGTLWRINADGTSYTVLRHLSFSTDGANPQGAPVFGSDGKLYGTTSIGGTYTQAGGTLWTMNADGTGFTVLRHLNSPLDGSNPESTPVFGVDGKLHGTTYSGGTFGAGTIWRMNSDGTGYAVLRHLNSADGQNPRGAPVFGSDGRLYGANVGGGTNRQGTLWRIDADGANFTVLRHLNSLADGQFPHAAPVFGSDGKLYGTTSGGGTNGFGTLWQMNADGTGYTVLRHLSSLADGQNPQSAPVFGSDGKLYGTINGGGTYGEGTLWRINTDATSYSVLRHLSSGADGANPSAAPVFGSDGRLYGTNRNGGTFGGGTLWRMNTDGTSYSVLRHLNSPADGAAPQGAPVVGSDGKLYGTAAVGGTQNGGTLWRMNADGASYTVLRHLNISADGGNPYAAPVFGSDGKLYGTAGSGGTFGGGTLWRMNVDGTGYTMLHELDYFADGADPRGALVFGSDSRLYGTTSTGGSFFNGTLWRMNADGSSFTVLRHLNSPADGAIPEGALVFGSDGKLYGATVTGGTLDGGTLWRMNADGTSFTVLRELDPPGDGASPGGTPVFGSDGRLYGTTFSGGTNGAGTLWRMNADGTNFTVLHYLNSSLTGSRPRGKPVFGSDGKLYGTTSEAGPSGLGTIFAWSNQPPTAAFFATPNPATVGATVTFNASASTEPDGDARVFDWQFGDGSAGNVVQNLPLTTHVFASPGIFTASLQVSDSFGATSAVVTGNVTVVSVNQPPTANAQSISATEDNARQLALTGSDPDGNPLSYALASNPTHGTLTGTPPNLIYTPAANYNGSDSFTFRVNDGTVDSAPATVSITVAAVNDPPVANGASLTAIEDGFKVFVLAGSDVDADALTYAIVTSPAHGVLSGTAPALTYTPAANYNGPDSFTFKVNDGTIDSATATVTVTVTATNDAPVATAQSVTTPQNTGKPFTLTGSDVDGDALSYLLLTHVAHGTLSGTPPNMTYTPATNYTGPDSFNFKVNDGTIDSVQATVSITVTQANSAPVANAQAVAANEDVAKAITLTGSDADGNALTFVVVSGPTKGSLTGSGANLSYAPNANYNGPDSFMFKVNDGALDSAPAIVSITVAAVNDPPVANAQSVTTVQSTAKSITLSGTDVDGNTLTYAIVTPPAHGALAGTAPNLTYTPAANYNGPDSFTFNVNDGTVDSATATVSITITPIVPLQIVTQPANTAVVVGQTATFTVVANASLPISYQWRKGNAAISGATSATFVIPIVQPADEASYRVVVSTTDSSITSSWASLTLLVPPTITQQPADVVVGTGRNATFTVKASGTTPLTYQWKKGNAEIPGATSSRIQLQKVGLADAGVYTVVVTNAGGTTTSNPVTLTVQ